MDCFVINQRPVPTPYHTEICRLNNACWKIICKWPPMPKEEAVLLNNSIPCKKRMFLTIQEHEKKWEGWVVTEQKKQPYEFTHMNRKWVGCMDCSFWGVQES